MSNLKRICSRLYRSAVAWSWIMNGLRLTAGILVLPLLAVQLAKPDFDMYFVFLSLSALVPILDLGFSSSIGRAVSYAMGGATKLKAQGFVPQVGVNGPNHELLWKLLQTTRKIYRLLSLGTIVLLGCLGTLLVAKVVPETTRPTLTWIAWGLTLIAVLWEIYSGWWNVFLRNMDQVLVSTQQLAVAQAVKVALSAALLLAGGDLLSVPLATITSSLLQRSLARRQVRRLLGTPTSKMAAAELKAFVATLWPNSWRVGLQYLSSYLAGQANTLICLPLLGLAAGGTYGFSLQLIMICSSMAQVWMQVKWPLIGQLRIQQDYAALRRLIWPRIWLQYFTYLVLVLGVILVVPALLQWHGSEKNLMPSFWLTLLALHGFLEMNYIFWGTLISTENRTPFTWPIITSNLVSFLLVLILLKTTRLGLGVPVLAPLLVNTLYNHWKWPQAGAQSLHTTWWRLLRRSAFVESNGPAAS